MTKKIFGYNEVKQHLKQLTESYMILQDESISEYTRQIYERVFCESAGWFTFYSIHVEFKGADKGFKIVDQDFKDRIIDDDIIAAFTALKDEVERGSNDMKKITQLKALLENENYKVEFSTDKRRPTAELIIHRKVFKCGKQ